jgi:hypothetical protein
MKRVFCSVLLAATTLGSGCYQFHLVGPSEPEPVSQPQLVSVMIEYRQPFACQADASACDQAVTFSASWMQAGTQFSLVRDAGNTVWRGTAYAVPVNYPPRAAAYSVQVFDPLLKDEASAGKTAQRLVIGGENVRSLADENTPQARGFIYIDAEGHGRNVY